MRVALKFAYDGRKFHGFARQPNVETIEGNIIKFLIEHGLIEDIKESKFRCASRTDKGVSSLGNVIAFNTEKNLQNIYKDCNICSDKIVIFGKKIVDDNFYPRYAKQRIYRYYLKKKEYSFETITLTALLFKGTHNFSNFARIESNKNPVRTIDDIEVHENEDSIILEFYAQTYLWHQIRKMVSAILQVENKKIKTQQIIDALTKPKKHIDFGLATPEPLILIDVLYSFYFDSNDYWINKKKEFEEELLYNIKCHY